jgi:type I restriction enzyme S subunit
MISLFQSPWLKNNLERIKSGTTNVFAIYYKELADLPVVVPPLPLQQKFTALVQRHRQLRLAQEESFRQADHLFQTLLHQAFAN